MHVGNEDAHTPLVEYLCVNLFVNVSTRRPRVQTIPFFKSDKRRWRQGADLARRDDFVDDEYPFLNTKTRMIILLMTASTVSTTYVSENITQGAQVCAQQREASVRGVCPKRSFEAVF